ncbi:Transcriptional regulator [Tenacibaculum maritimum]|uniref:transcriptional regulator n=1 Tax=Tenacibaculum maritimum TaxID=107401 RepID=UPI0012E6735B|nr:transcriptional regulator [Tenacibaculum maritimum]CAA0229376.1 Transcriptional regulator [Tenacibaculum maritimum]
MEDINKEVCGYIASNWIKEHKSIRSFALDHYIDEKTARKIRQKGGYRMPISTLKKICDSRKISLSTFFSLLEGVID